MTQSRLINDAIVHDQRSEGATDDLEYPVL